MRRLELLIEEARALSQNTRYDSDSGVSQDIFVRYFKNAQDFIQRQVISSKSKYFRKSKTFSSVNSQEEYNYPSDIYMQSIELLEYSEDGIHFIPIDPIYSSERVSNEVGYAYGYQAREKKILVNPPVRGGGSFRVTYNRALNSPQKRCGKISAITVNSGVVSAITLNTGESSFDATLLNKEYYLCIVNRDGEIVASTIEYDSVDSGTGVVTLSPHTLTDDDTTPAVGDYVCVGKRAVNLIELPDPCESFLIDYVVYQAKKGDSSSWTQEEVKQWTANFAQIADNFARKSDDPSDVPITNYEYLEI